MLAFLTRAAVAALALAANLAIAQTAYPAKPIRVIVGIAPGSVTDLVMRAVAQELTPRLGQPLVIENRPGGNMIIGADACAKSAPDGYTLCVLGVDALSTNVHTIEKLPYDPERDLKPVSNLFYVLEALVVNPGVPVSTVAELRAFAAARPGALNFGTLGPDSSPDLFLGWLRDQWKAEMTAVPYKADRSPPRSWRGRSSFPPWAWATSPAASRAAGCAPWRWAGTSGLRGFPTFRPGVRPDWAPMPCGRGGYWWCRPAPPMAS